MPKYSYQCFTGPLTGIDYSIFRGRFVTGIHRLAHSLSLPTSQLEDIADILQQLRDDPSTRTYQQVNQASAQHVLMFIVDGFYFVSPMALREYTVSMTRFRQCRICQTLLNVNSDERLLQHFQGSSRSNFCPLTAVSRHPGAFYSHNFSQPPPLSDQIHPLDLSIF